MSAQGVLGLDGSLSWQQARFVAAQAARPLSARTARLDESAGCLLAAPLTTLADDPAEDCAEFSGYALCGEGPWTIVELPHDVALSPHCAALVTRREPVPPHTDCVIGLHESVVREEPDGRTIVTAHDPLTGLPEEYARPDLGYGIVRQAARGHAGTMLVPRGTRVTPQLISLAARYGHDHLSITPPPTVGTLVLGAHLLERGMPRFGRPRDALGYAIPAFIATLGARANPAVRAPETRDLLLEEIDDANVDLLITTGNTGENSELREVLRDLNARWLIDGVEMTPGAGVLLARLADDRLLLGLPGDPVQALAALMSLAPIVVAKLRDDQVDPAHLAEHAVLLANAPLPHHAHDTGIVPVMVTRSAAGTTALPLENPGELTTWAQANAFAVVPPGEGAQGRTVGLLPPLGS